LASARSKILQFCRKQIFKRSDEKDPVLGSKRVVDPPQSEAPEEREFDTPARHGDGQDKCILVFLNCARVADKLEARFDFTLLERIGLEEIEVDRDAMTQMEGNGSSSIKHER